MKPSLAPSSLLLVETFREWLLMRGCSPRTAKDYPEDVKPFLALLEAQEVENIRSVTAAHLLGYQGRLMEKQHRGKPLSLRTVSGRMSQVKSFFRFLLKTGRIYHDVAAAVEIPRRARTLPRGVLSEKEILALLEGPSLARPIGIRDRAMLELLYSCGIRNQEIRHLTLKDLDVDGRTLHVMGKGGKEGAVPFGKEAARALENYLLYARPVLLRSYTGARAKTERTLLEEAGKDYVFLTKNGYRIDHSSLCKMLWRYANKAGLTRKISPHGLRHTCATHLLKNGADIRHIQKLLRHNDISTTQIYTRVAIEDLKDAQAKFHPREQPRE
jgi:integrase/recombinase XerD